MTKLIVNKLPRIIKSKKKLEKILNIKLSNRGREITIEGTPENEYTAEKVIEAISFGFEFQIAILIKEQDFVFEIINIKDYTKRSDLQTIKARIIGKKGKALNTLSQLTKCDFQLSNNKVGIIGPPESIQNAQEAIISIIKGSKHGNVYFNIEKHQPKEIIDLGLRKKK